ncbi:unnamed protein product (macronuclear) [Paramecium tetraurelia]|uniref:Poly(A) RNA polymerase mitochondrial-like central palm domain-containing protein n=1 Tax=Paramecium tetraurelia TaxID=5888 RepID=A0EBF2_PARTE|nr:uncharacterized protein GSPATT00025353001 [Paramecium tetraurelia]CAK92619.1 unnamed protein product [Paramecium tetraurelia]|eukprot:XP_001460016.1 hypothetical protein (macronuclear) [Paramecium tetraurelia strain d4-2]
MFHPEKPKEIERCLELIYQNSLGDQAQEDLINDTTQAFKKFLHQNELAQRKTIILMFGSLYNGFKTKKSDVDISITTNSYIPEVTALSYWIAQLGYQTRFKLDQSFLKSRVPVIKILDQQNLVHIDLCYNNLLGAINTRLLKAYSLLNLKVKQGGVLLKVWAKGAKIVTNVLFSSYSIIILWLHFLQANYGLPNLQNQKYNFKNIDSDLTIKRTLYDKENVTKIKTFFVYEGETYEKLKLEFQAKISQVSLQTLLQEFFCYYSQNGQGFNQPYKISINLKELKDQGLLYSMSDPFDPLHDPLKKINKAFKNNRVFDNATQFMKTQQETQFLFQDLNQQLHY